MVWDRVSYSSTLITNKQIRQCSRPWSKAAHEDVPELASLDIAGTHPGQQNHAGPWGNTWATGLSWALGCSSWVGFNACASWSGELATWAAVTAGWIKTRFIKMEESNLWLNHLTGSAKRGFCSSHPTHWRWRTWWPADCGQHSWSEGYVRPSATIPPGKTTPLSTKASWDL